MAENPPNKPNPLAGKGDDDLNQRISNLELQLAQTRAGTPLGTLPNNSAGVADDIAETWSQYDQELASIGEHPDQD